MMVILLQIIHVCCGLGIEKDRDSEKNKIKINKKNPMLRPQKRSNDQRGKGTKELMWVS
jgi:hypothetical protein